MDRLERTIDRNTVEGIAHGAAQSIVRAKACDAKRGGRLERADIGNLAHQAREVATGRGITDHVIDFARLECLEALVDVGEGLLVGGDALLGERLLRGGGHLDAQGSSVERVS